MQGRFNLNSLVTLEGGQLKFDQPAIERFERLLELLELETKWAKIIADWIDTRHPAEFPRWRGRPDLHRPHRRPIAPPTCR